MAESEIADAVIAAETVGLDVPADALADLPADVLADLPGLVADEPEAPEPINQQEDNPSPT